MSERTGIYAREAASLNRVVQLGVAGGRVISVSFPESIPADAEADHPLLDRVFAYLGGDEDDFSDVELALTVPTDQRRVLDAVEKIPYGRTVSFDRLLNLAGLDEEDERDRETARQALAGNPVPIFVPDHRVRNAPGATPDAVAERLRTLES